MATDGLDPREEARRRLLNSFSAQEVSLSAALMQTRAENNHGGVKGSRVEVAVREFLRNRLPRRLDIGHGEVIDQSGRRSRQLDVVVSDLDQPFSGSGDDPALFLVDGVAACGEVKTTLTTGNMSDLIEKGSALKRLRYSSYEHDQVVVNPSDYLRFHASPAFFGVALESQVSDEALITRLATMEPVTDPRGEGPNLAPVDAVFALGQSPQAAIDLGDGQGRLGSWLTPTGETGTGWGMDRRSGPLVAFFLWLSIIMPRRTRLISTAAPYLVDEYEATPWIPLR